MNKVIYNPFTKNYQLISNTTDWSKSGSKQIHTSRIPELSISEVSSGSLNFPTTSGAGLRVNNNYVWHDLLGSIVTKAGGSDPTLDVYNGTLKSYEFSNSSMNEVFVEYHIPHQYAINTDIYIHTHWSQKVVDTGGPGGLPGQIKWYFDFAYAKGHSGGAFNDVNTLSVTQSGSTTAFTHQIAEVQISSLTPNSNQINSADIEPDGVILTRCYRDPTDVDDTLNEFPFLHFVDIHYLSKELGTINKSPNFYE